MERSDLRSILACVCVPVVVDLDVDVDVRRGS
jgi:hypothetical protein